MSKKQDKHPTMELFDWQSDALKTMSKRDTGVVKTQGKKHPYFYDLDPHFDYANNEFVIPSDFFERNNGKRQTRYVGNEEMPLVRCIRKANKDYLNMTPADQKEFFLGDKSLKRWAKDSDCTVAFLMAAILVDKRYGLRNTPVFNYVTQLVDAQ